MGVQLLAALRAMFAKNRTQITSKQWCSSFSPIQTRSGTNMQWHEYRG